MQPGLRSRDLDRSARRGLSATLRQLELACSGLDLWIPPAHFTDPSKVDRAIAAMLAGIELAADLGRVPVSVLLPATGEGVAQVIEAVSRAAQRLGPPVADHAAPPSDHAAIGVGIDPVACLAAGLRPDQVVLQSQSRLVAARLSDLRNDGLRGPIGEAQRQRLDVAAYKVALSVAAFRHPVVIDARQWSDPIRGISQTAALWNRL
jgi:sugar phosphate isomerase/epimerase